MRKLLLSVTAAGSLTALLASAQPAKSADLVRCEGKHQYLTGCTTEEDVQRLKGGRHERIIELKLFNRETGESDQVPVKSEHIYAWYTVTAKQGRSGWQCLRICKKSVAAKYGIDIGEAHYVGVCHNP